ncbi:hypothetical protein [Georgenia sp. SYP-B2076]|nr:hypothetical protein [Georgenia sp. SYP-B2076]
MAPTSTYSSGRRAELLAELAATYVLQAQHLSVDDARTADAVRDTLRG